MSSGHTGIKSRLWKVVTVDGVETERTLLHTDTYNASKAVYEVGPAVPAETAPPVTETAPQTTPEQTQPAAPSEGVGGGPGIGLTGPSATPSPAETAPAATTPAPTAPPQTAAPAPVETTAAPAPTAPPQPAAPAPGV